MPITVQHGGGQAGTVAGQILAQAGQARLDREQKDNQLAAQLAQQRYLQQQQIKAQAAMQKQASEDAYARMLAQFGLQDKAQESQFDREAEQLKLKAQLDAESFETRYTAKDKAEITKLRSQERAAYRMLQAGDITQEDYDKAVKQIKSQELGIMPGELPSLSPFPKGKAPGDFGVQGEGDLQMPGIYDKKGIFVPIDYRSFQSYQAKEHEYKATEKKADIDASERMKQAEIRMKVATEQIIDPDGKSPPRTRTKEEIDEIMQKIFPKPVDPAKIKNAKAYMEQVIEQYGNNMPPHIIEGMREAQAILKSAKNQGN